MNRTLRSASFEFLDYRHCLSSIGFTSEILIASETRDVALVETGDLDGDGAPDILIGGATGVAWYRNALDARQFVPQLSLTQEAAEQVFAVDLDGDQDLDVIASLVIGLNDYIVWFENTDGRGTFSDGEPILRAKNHAFNVGDLDRDGDVDLVTVLSLQDEIVWAENKDGKGTFGLPRFIDRQQLDVSVFEFGYGDLMHLALGDLDGDDDLDIFAAPSVYAASTVWYRNELDTAGFVREVLPAHSGLNASVAASDVDDDGDLDILSTDGTDLPADFVWRENDLLGTQGFSQKHEISKLQRPSAVVSGDLDDDGDLDVVYVAEPLGRERISQLIWQENLGAGQFGGEEILPTPSGELQPTIEIVDIDLDGDLDILVATKDRVLWFQSDVDTRLAGDANRDGQVTFEDYLILALNFDNRNAAWGDGDFNGDGLVLFDDFLILADHIETSTR